MSIFGRRASEGLMGDDKDVLVARPPAVSSAINETERHTAVDD
jgi:hypothetical protein